MESRTIHQLLKAYHACETTPDAWVDVMQGLRRPEDLARELAGVEAPDVIERSARLFAPPSDAREQARLRSLLCAPVFQSIRPMTGLRRWGVVMVALAAAVVLAVLLRPAPPFGYDYSVELEFSVQYVRSGKGHGADVGEYYEGEPIGVILRPAKTVDGVVAVVAVAYDEDAVGRPLQLTPRVLRNGVIEFRGEQGLGLPVGSWQLVFVVGPPGQLEDGIRGVPAETVASKKGAYEVVRARIVIVPKPEALR